MSHHIDELAKSLADEPISRRDSFRLFGAALAGAILAPFAVGTARAGRPDLCKVFCNQCGPGLRSRCLTACRACKNGDPSHLCTNCWNYSCCDSGETCCGSACHDLTDDFDNCGACYNACEDPGPYENAACVNGQCKYWCVEGAVVCNGACSLLDQDWNNCGSCGNVCPDATPICSSGTCVELFCPAPSTNCGRYCALLDTDPNNCGACGFQCPGGSGCADGFCY